MANASISTLPDMIDLKNRAIPAAERRATRSTLSDLGPALDVIDEISDDTDIDETRRYIFRSIDEARPNRPLLNGQY